MVALMAGLDFFVIIFPIDVFLITRMLLRPKNWLVSSLIIALGSALGAVSLGAFIQWDAASVTHFISRFVDLSSPEAVHASELIHAHGGLGLFIISLSFVPPQIAVFMAGIEKVSLPSIFLCVLLGRGLKYSFYSMLCVFFPKFIHKFHKPHTPKE